MQPLHQRLSFELKRYRFADAWFFGRYESATFAVF
jgi:hypothetical protein